MLIVLKGANFSENNIGKTEIPLLLDEDAEKFLNKAMLIDPAFDYNTYASPVNNLVESLKKYGIYDKLYFINMFIGDTIGTQQLSIKDVDSAKTYIFENDTIISPVYSKNGLYLNHRTKDSNDNYKAFKYSNMAFAILPEKITASNGFMLTAIDGNSPDVFRAGNIDVDGIGVGSIFTHWGKKMNTETINGNILSVVRENTTTTIYKEDEVWNSFTEDNGTFTSRSLSIGFSQNSLNSIVDENGNLSSEADRIQGGANVGINYHFQSLIFGEAMSTDEVKAIVNLVQEFNASIGRN